MARRGRIRNRSRIVSLKKPTSWTDWATIIGVPIGLAAVVLAALALSGGGGDPPTAPHRAHVKPVDLVVHNGIYADHPPLLEILLHNTGAERAVVSRADIEIRRVGLLRQCFSQGDLPLSTTYAATLPANAAPGDVVQAPLHEQLGDDEADRFAIELGVRADPASSSYSMGGRQSLAGLYLFEIAISMASDEGGHPLDVGRALVSLPSAPEPFGFYWDRASLGRLRQYSLAEAKSREELGDSIPRWPSPYTKKCWLSNTRTLRSMLSSHAKRSPTLEAVGAGIITPDMSLLEATGN
ncbi:MAG TPA: hypothetical protein VIM28_03745 [Solirubrobacterales bacterium]